MSPLDLPADQVQEEDILQVSTCNTEEIYDVKLQSSMTFNGELPNSGGVNKKIYKKVFKDALLSLVYALTVFYPLVLSSIITHGRFPPIEIPVRVAASAFFTLSFFCTKNAAEQRPIEAVSVQEGFLQHTHLQHTIPPSLLGYKVQNLLVAKSLPEKQVAVRS